MCSSLYIRSKPWELTNRFASTTIALITSIIISSFALGVDAKVIPTSSLTLPIHIKISLADRTQADVFIHNNNVIAKLSNGKTLLLINNISSIPEYARDIWASDFNFDGYKDLAITTSIDSFTNDQVYTILMWENGLKTFIPMGFQRKLSNIEVLKASKEIRSSYQLGDFWTEDTYRFTSKRPYLFSKSELIANDIWHTTIYTPQGKIINSLVSTDGRITSQSRPVLLTVTSPAYVYRSPVPSSILPIQLNRGDTVTVLDFKQTQGRLNWVNIQSTQNEKTIKGWVLLSNLLHS